MNSVSEMASKEVEPSFEEQNKLQKEHQIMENLSKAYEKLAAKIRMIGGDGWLVQRLVVLEHALAYIKILKKRLAATSTSESETESILKMPCTEVSTAVEPLRGSRECSSSHRSSSEASSETGLFPEAYGADVAVFPSNIVELVSFMINYCPEIFSN